MRSRPSAGGLVYSTDHGRMCPVCRQPQAQCDCKTAAATALPSDGIVRISRETKGRGGKAVTVVRGLAADAASLEEAARQLKAACGCGGTIKDEAIEIQGDHCDRLRALLEARGYRVKRAGA